MCVVCNDWNKGKMTSKEALRALGELIQSNGEYSEENEHYYQLSERILDKEVPVEDSDADLDYLWQQGDTD